MWPVGLFTCCDRLVAPRKFHFWKWFFSNQGILLNKWKLIPPFNDSVGAFLIHMDPKRFTDPNYSDQHESGIVHNTFTTPKTLLSKYSEFDFLIIFSLSACGNWPSKWYCRISICFSFSFYFLQATLKLFSIAQGHLVQIIKVISFLIYRKVKPNTVLKAFSIENSITTTSWQMYLCVRVCVRMCGCQRQCGTEVLYWFRNNFHIAELFKGVSIAHRMQIIHATDQVANSSRKLNMHSLIESLLIDWKKKRRCVAKEQISLNNMLMTIFPRQLKCVTVVSPDLGVESIDR